MTNTLLTLLKSLLPKSYNPASLENLIKKRARTKPDSSLHTQRHPDNQGGMTVDAAGTTSLRAGHALTDNTVGASVSLTADGHVVITAPGGIVLSGKVYTAQSPEDALAFRGGITRFDARWETESLITLVAPETPLDIPILLENYYVSAGPNLPATVPLSEVLALATLFASRPPGE
jgi:hypothetical protein